MSTPSERRLRLRALLAGDACLTPASVADALSMRAAESLGFEVAMLAGSVASLAVLGAPDIALLTLSELAEQTRRITRAGALPLVVDGDHGYGNALNVRRTVEELEAAGAAGVSIEDAVLPATFGGGKPALVSPRELGAKLRAALDARQDPGFLIVGRTNAGLAADKAELQARIAALQDAGVECLFFTGVRALETLEVIAAASRVPIVLGTGIAGVSREQLAQRRVRLCLGGHRAHLESVVAYYRQLGVQRHGVAGDIDGAALLKTLSGVADYDAWAKEYLE